MVLFICQCSTGERLSLRLWLTLLPGKKAKGKEAIRRNKFHRAEVPILKVERWTSIWRKVFKFCLFFHWQETEDGNTTSRPAARYHPRSFFARRGGRILVLYHHRDRSAYMASRWVRYSEKCNQSHGWGSSLHRNSCQLHAITNNAPGESIHAVLRYLLSYLHAGYSVNHSLAFYHIKFNTIKYKNLKNKTPRQARRSGTLAIKQK